jgi:ribosomal protein L7Ae-like RNA K-turn-binding protein
VARDRERSDALELLGLAQRAGAVERGVDAARRAVREGRARLIILADDASATQLRKLTGLLEHRSVPRRRVADRAALGAALGAAPVSAVAITRSEFAESMLERLPEGEGDADAQDARRDVPRDLTCSDESGV